VETKLQQLPVDERIKLVEDLWNSIAADQSALPLTEYQKIELDRRLAAYAIDTNHGQIATDAVSNIRPVRRASVTPTCSQLMDAPACISRSD